MGLLDFNVGKELKKLDPKDGKLHFIGSYTAATINLLLGPIQDLGYEIVDIVSSGTGGYSILYR